MMKKDELIKISLVSVIFLAISFATLYVIGRKGISDHKINNSMIPPWGYPLKNTFSFKMNYQNMEFAYELNEFYLRELEGSRERVSSKHFFMAGGSNTFGQNLKVSQTLSAKLLESKRFKDYNHQILASPGWGPTNVLSYMQMGPFRKLSTNEEGVFIFNFIQSHFHRVCGLDQSLFWSKGILPKYEVVNNEMKYLGLFKDTSEFQFFLVRNGIYKALFNFVDKKNKILDRKLGSKCVSLTMSVFKEMKKEYLSVFKKGRFIISLFPTMKEMNRSGMKELIKGLRALDIEVLNYPDYKENYNKEYFFKDSHVNERSNTHHTKLLLERI